MDPLAPPWQDQLRRARLREGLGSATVEVPITIQPYPCCLSGPYLAFPCSTRSGSAHLACVFHYLEMVSSIAHLNEATRLYES